MIDTRAVTDVVGSTLASIAHLCAREVLKGCQQIRQSRTIGEFVVSSGVAEVRRRFAPPAKSEPCSGGTVADQTVLDTAVTEQTVSQPMPDYDLLTSAQVVELLDTVSPEALRAVLDYEMSHRRRRLVVEAAQRLLGP